MSDDALPWTILHGRPEPPPEPVPLQAGPLSLLFEEGDIKYVCLGGREVLRRVYAAVRDCNWGTVPGRISSLRIDSRDDSFRIVFLSEHRQHEIHFVWRGTIEGSRDGTVRFDFDGEARSSFQRARIGFCVLHPIRECAGTTCIAEHADGTVERGLWPRLISPVAPFKDLRGLKHEVFPGLWAHVELSGEVFEMEDHRNWTDCSYKTFCTPLAIPYPVQVEAGARVRQRVTLRLEGALPELPAEACDATPVLRLEAGTHRPLPAVGLGCASHGAPLEARELETLRALRLSHLRVELRLAQPGWESALRQAWREAEALGARLEVAIFVSGGARGELEALVEACRTVRHAVRAWLIFHEREKVTSAHWVELAREVLRGHDPHARIGSGTNVELTDLNREPPRADLLDLACYSISPQVHAFDNDSLVETLEAQADTVATARALLGETRLAITPVTLRRRFNPDATGPEPPPPPGELPSQVDPRQASLFAAAWTVGSLKRLAEAGVESVTYYETTGWQGVMETASGSPLPERFPSLPGAVFPVYHVLADLGEHAGGEVLACPSSDPLKVQALVLSSGPRLSVLVANLRPHDQAARLEGLPHAVRLRWLDAARAHRAMTDPAAFRGEAGEALDAAGGVLELSLPPYAVLRIDGESGS